MRRLHCLLLIISILALSCGQRNREALIEPSETTEDIPTESVADAVEASKTATSQAAPAKAKDLYAGFSRNVIKKAHFRFKVTDVHRSAEAIETLLKKWPAYVETSNLSQESNWLENKMTIRIQNEYFSECLQAIGNQAVKIDFRNITTDDVSKEFVDLESRLRTKREVEARYMAILRNRAGTIEEVLEAERQIGQLHEEIEAAVQRLNYLKDQVGYSTIALEFYQLTAVQSTDSDSDSPLLAFKEAFKTGWEALKTFVLVLVYLWPLILGVGIVLLIIKLRKRRMAKI